VCSGCVAQDAADLPTAACRINNGYFFHLDQKRVSSKLESGMVGPGHLSGKPVIRSLAEDVEGSDQLDE
jgi:hypothetical protein